MSPRVPMGRGATLRRSALCTLAALLLPSCDGSPTDARPDPACDRLAASVLELPPPPAHLAARRAALAAAVSDGVVVIAAERPDPDPGNNGYRGDPSLFYLAGLDVPGAWLVIHVRARNVERAVLYLPREATSAGGPVAASEVSAAHAIRCADRLPADVRALAEGGRTLITAWRNAAAEDTLLVALRDAGYAQTVTGHVATLRAVKDTAEIARLRTAATITAQSIAAAASAIRAGNDEGDVATAILAGFLARGAAGASFPSIVAAGESALVLHYNENDRPLAGDELILMDVGAEYARYSGDVTRTYPVSGRFGERQRALYELVLGAQQAVIAAVRPGAFASELEQVGRAYLRDHSAGLCGALTCDRYLVHLVTHGVGLNVHDPAGGNLLRAGMVLAVEPGLYLPAEGIGIRIEDDVLVTETGAEILSLGAPKTVAEIEALFGG